MSAVTEWTGLGMLRPCGAQASRAQRNPLLQKMPRGPPLRNFWKKELGGQKGLGLWANCIR